MTRKPDVRSPFKRSWQHPIDDPRPPRAEPVQAVVGPPNGLGDRHDPQLRRAEPVQALGGAPT